MELLGRVALHGWRKDSASRVLAKSRIGGMRDIHLGCLSQRGGSKRAGVLHHRGGHGRGSGLISRVHAKHLLMQRPNIIPIESR